MDQDYPSQETRTFDDVESLLAHARQLRLDNHIVLRAYTNDYWIGFDAWQNITKPPVEYHLRLAKGVNTAGVDPMVIYT